MSAPSPRSPNFDARGDTPIEIVVLHYTGMIDPEATRARLCDPAPTLGRYRSALGPAWREGPDDQALGRVSAHYLIDETGRVDALVEETARAWHAGAADWGGRGEVNARSIGIELVNGGHDWPLPEEASADRPAPYAPAQIAALIGLLKEILPRHGLGSWAVVGHSDVAPDRKTDPGERFPWAQLARAGVGLAFAAPPDRGAVLARPGSAGAAVRALQAGLADWGYGLALSGGFDARTQKVVEAFQRRANAAPDGLWREGDAEALERALRLRASARAAHD